MPARRMTITGHVQGVFFRAGVQEKADALGIRGWIRNTAEGSVEIHAEGDLTGLQKLETWCARGPELARVDTVNSSEVSEEGFSGFRIVQR